MEMVQEVILSVEQFFFSEGISTVGLFQRSSVLFQNEMLMKACDYKLP